jgi:hypothetical protein
MLHRHLNHTQVTRRAIGALIGIQVRDPLHECLHRFNRRAVWLRHIQCGACVSQLDGLPLRKKLLLTVQLLHVHLIPHALEPPKALRCPHCGAPMRIYATKIPARTARTIAGLPAATRSSVV